MSRPATRTLVYHAIRESQDGRDPLAKFFDKAYELKGDAISKIELFARPNMGDLLNYMLAKLIANVDESSDLEELVRDFDYAARQLAAAGKAVEKVVSHLES